MDTTTPYLAYHSPQIQHFCTILYCII